MGSKYTSQSISGYNSSAPADDGTQTDSNKVKWSTIKTKLGDPIKTLAQEMNSALVTALDTSARSITANDTATAADNGKTIEIASTVTAALTVTLPDAATVGAGYMVSYFNSGSGTVTVAKTGSDTINGATSLSLYPRMCAAFATNASGNGYIGNILNAVVVSTSGNVGIGTSNPTKKLEVNGDAKINGHTIGRGNYDDSSNVAVGVGALAANVAGTSNTAIGGAALNSADYGGENTAVGYGAGSGIASGSKNTAVGINALSSGSSAKENCSGLGYYAQVTGNNQVQLGDSSTTTYAYGSVQNRSDARDKADIRDTQLGLAFISSLRPVDFRWDYREDYDWASKDGSKKRSRYHHGLIAQEVKQTLDAMGVDFGGYQDHSLNGGKDVLSIGYAELIGPLIKAVQELSARVAALEAK